MRSCVDIDPVYRVEEVACVNSRSTRARAARSSFVEPKEGVGFSGGATSSRPPATHLNGFAVEEARSTEVERAEGDGAMWALGGSPLPLAYSRLPLADFSSLCLCVSVVNPSSLSETPQLAAVIPSRPPKRSALRTSSTSCSTWKGL